MWRLIANGGGVHTEPRKGGFSKGVSAETSVTLKETKNSLGYWAQQYIWHSEHQMQERRTYLQNPLLKPPSFVAAAGGMGAISFLSPS